MLQRQVQGLTIRKDALHLGAQILPLFLTPKVVRHQEASVQQVLPQGNDFIVEGEYNVHYVTHCNMGVSCAVADIDPDGRVTLYSQSQYPFIMKMDIAPALGMHPGDVRIVQPPVGPPEEVPAEEGTHDVMALLRRLDALDLPDDVRVGISALGSLPHQVVVDLVSGLRQPTGTAPRFADIRLYPPTR